MKNALKYYYNLEPNEIHQFNNIYKFHISNTKYMLCPYNRNIEDIREIYNIYLLISNLGIYCHKIITNINNEIITNINNQIYILLIIQIENRIINIDDILYLLNVNININEYTKIKRMDWLTLWTEKIDYIEYQISQFGKKYPILRESSDYYIGITENCISLISNNNLLPKMYSISHDRISIDMTTEEFYNPINFIIDIKVRNISEYIKSSVKNINSAYNLILYSIYNGNLTAEEIMLMFIRIMYPSEYFDEYEKIISNDSNEKTLEQIISNVNEYEDMIRQIYHFIKTIINIPEIEWLKKTWN